MGLPTGKTKSTKGPLLWSLIIIFIGIIFLLNNFLFLNDFDPLTLLPLIFVILGAQILLRGDFIPSNEARRFGITRGSVEAGTLEISSGEIDVEIRALSADFRLRDEQYGLIAGQFALNSRPQLRMDGTYAHLRMSRGNTPWYSFADWKIALANDLPWQILTSAYLGQIDYDLSDLIIHDGVIATGIGDIRIVSPKESFGTLHLRSTLGNIQFIAPFGYNTRIVVQTHRFFKVNVDETRYEAIEPNVYMSLEIDPEAPLVEIHISGTFGDAYLA